MLQLVNMVKISEEKQGLAQIRNSFNVLKSVWLLLFFKYGPIPASFCLFSSFQHFEIQI